MINAATRLMFAISLFLVTACGGDGGGSIDSAADALCDCVAAPEDHAQCVAALEMELEDCSQECLDCINDADSCQEIDEGCDVCLACF